MRPTVYIETTIPSYYHDGRPEIAGDIARTREWWDQERGAYECFISPVVIDELSDDSYAHQSDCLGLVASIPLLGVTSEAAEIAEVFQAQGLMPREPVRDALHLAVACVYRIDYLLTWNCRHLANANKVRPLRILGERMGISVPLLVTPRTLILE